MVKLTSMGDVLHVMPALSDLQQHYPDLIVDWMVEDSFAQLPAWHSAVERVIPVATRRWRKLSWQAVREFRTFWKGLRAQSYDAIIDAQGLMKSAVFARMAKLTKYGQRIGFSGDSIKESPAAYLYSTKVKVLRKQHAVNRLRQLFAGGFDYACPQTPPNYSISNAPAPHAQVNESRPSVFLLHATTWPSKHVADQSWRELAKLALNDGYQVKLCWASEQEKRRADWIAEIDPNITVLPKSSLNQVAAQLRQARGAIAVDTGLGHMAAAFGVACVSLYGATDALLTGTMGDHQTQLQAAYPCSPCLLKKCNKLTATIESPPCYTHLPSAQIWQRLREQISQQG